MTTKKKFARMVSPKGPAIWPKLNAPDFKYKKEGEFAVRIEYDPESTDGKAFIAKMEALRDEEFAKFASENPKKKKAKMAPLFREETDDEGDETGKVSFNFKMKHKITRKSDGKEFTMFPTILNAKRDELKNPPNIGGGSVLKVAFEAVPYFNEKDKEFGLTLRLSAVQIITLVEFGGSRAANDFDDEDGDDIEDGAPKPKAKTAGDEFEEDEEDEEADAEDGDGDY
jgi:hypothetical protein